MAAVATIYEPNTQTAAPTTDGTRQNGKTKTRRVIIDWTSHTDGTVSASNVARTTGYYSGFLTHVETDPDGTDVPTAYTLTVLNDQGTDLLCGAGTARSTTANEIVQPTPNSTPGPVMFSGTRLELQIASAGSGKKGRAILHFILR